MDGVVYQESRGNPQAIGPQTKWGRARGSTQMLDTTAKAMAAKAGLPWRPDLMTAGSPQAAAYQRKLGETYLQEGLEKTGNARDALHYYHGGPDRAQWGPKTRAYANSILARLK